MRPPGYGRWPCRCRGLDIPRDTTPFDINATSLGNVVADILAWDKGNHAMPDGSLNVRETVGSNMSTEVAMLIEAVAVRWRGWRGLGQLQ